MAEEANNPVKIKVYKAVDITMHLAGGSYFIEKDGISIARFPHKEDRDYFIGLALIDEQKKSK
jgi:hypothetical protein